MTARFDGPVRTARLTLHVRRAGRGRPLLFLGGSSTDMRLRAPVFASVLPARFDVIAFEPRGLGRSDRPPGPWTMADYAADALALMDALGLEAAHVLGESFGAMTALELALAAPGRVPALALMAGTPGGRLGRSFPLETLADLAPQDRARRLLAIQDSRFAARAAADLKAAEAEVAARTAQEAAFLADPGNRAGYPRLLAARAGHDVSDRLGRIAVPTLVMAGEHDGQAPLPAVQAMAAAIPGAAFQSFPGGHGFGFATPEPVAHLLAHWHAEGAECPEGKGHSG